MPNSLDNLLRCADDVQDFYRRLGGSNQYSGFMNWHIPAFVLLLNQNKADFEVLPSGIWQNNQELQALVKSRLISNPPTMEDIVEFMGITTKQCSKFKDERERVEWLIFCDSTAK